MGKPKGYYTDEQGHVRPVTGKQPHIKPLTRTTKRLGIPKRQLKKKRVKGFSKLTRVSSRAQGTYGHSISHSPRYQKSVIDRMGREKGEEFLRREHDFLALHYTEDPASSPFKMVVHTRKLESKKLPPKIWGSLKDFTLTMRSA